jgi:T-complex protein 1 subunit delta
MDKMITTSSGEVVITNDGATILKHMSVMHPAARMVRSIPSSSPAQMLTVGPH